MSVSTDYRGLRGEFLGALPALVLTGLLMVWVGASGGYSAETWYPTALVALALLGVVIIAGGRTLPDSPGARVGLLAFAALVAFNYLSILWAASPGSALDASNQLALYLIVAWVFAVLNWTPARLAVVLGLWSLAAFVACAVALTDALSTPNLTTFFVNGRFAPPTHYSNASGALAVMGMWPALILSSRRELPVGLRGLGLGIAVFLAGFATLPQSRATLLGLALTAPVVLLVGSNRARLLTRMLVVGGSLAICLPRTIRVDQAVAAGQRVEPVLRSAAEAMIVTALAAAAVGIAIGLVEGRFSPRAPGDAEGRGDGRSRGFFRVRMPRPHPAAVVALVLVAVSTAGVIAWPQVMHLVHTVVRQGNQDANLGRTRLTSTSPEERLDYYRVALHLFAQAPVAGIGDGNFGRAYDARRRFYKHSQYTHNLPLRVLSETGAIGTVMFAVLVVSLLIGMVNAARRSQALVRAAITAAAALSSYFLVHSTLDWVDQFPALAVPAIGFPMAALALAGTMRAPGATETSRPQTAPARVRTFAGRVAGGIGVLVALAVFVALSTSYLSLVYIDRAFRLFRDHPQQAYHDLSVAGSLNPLSVNALTSEGTIALYSGDEARAQSAFERSLRQEEAWYPRVELLLMDAQAGRFAAARSQLAVAERLDVHDPLLHLASDMIAHRVRIEPMAFNQRVVAEGQSGFQTFIR